jgi:uncharacterized protein (DUF2252 family)
MRGQKPHGVMTREERQEFGKTRREVVHRVDQANWAPPDTRRDPIEIINAISATREQDLIPIKMGRMAVSPFNFFRGAAPVMAADLVTLPATGIHVQMCGDAHVRNLGAFAAPDGHLVFDLNDFDETFPGPWEWDLKRLATSLVLAGNEAGDNHGDCKDAVLALVQSYREAMDNFAEMTMIDLVRFEVHRHTQESFIRSILGKAERLTPAVTLEKLTCPARGGLRRFVERPPLLHHIPEEMEKKVLASLGPYRETLSPDRQRVLDAYHSVDVTFKVVGTGSVGTLDYVVLCFGNGPEDPLFIQVKEEPPSCYAPYLPDVPPYPHQGKRVAEGQRLMQTASDPFLGWTSINGRDFLVRQLADHKAGADPAELQGETLIEFGVVCGQILAKAHARTGDALEISAYCGKADKVDKALAQFAAAYARQTSRDHEALVRAIKEGKIKAKHQI